LHEGPCVDFKKLAKDADKKSEKELEVFLVDHSVSNIFDIFMTCNIFLCYTWYSVAYEEKEGAEVPQMLTMDYEEWRMPFYEVYRVQNAFCMAGKTLLKIETVPCKYKL